MKSLFFALLMVSPAVFAGVSDTQLGPVVAVRRHVTDVEQMCVQNTTDDKTKNKYAFLCLLAFPVTANETVTVTNPIKIYRDQSCSVEVNYSRPNISIVFGTLAGNSSFADAQTCLNRALSKDHDSLELLIFKAL